MILLFHFFLYIDSFEVNNPLGSHRVVHTLTGVYYSFPSMPTKFLSSLENIFVANIFITNDNKTYGNRSCLQLLMEEIKELSVNGIEIVVEMKNYQKYFEIGLLIGDNLGLNIALGFSQSFSSNFYCRFCKENKNTLRKKADSNSIALRNKENYNADLLIRNASLTGVSEESMFKIAPHFHAVKNFSVDIMHDLFEGVFNYHMSSIILFFIENSNLFTLETLNNRKQTFQYVETEIGNISPPIKLEDLRKYKFKMSAREML